MFSLNYYKGFSLFRTGNLEETATVICNMVYKLTKEAANKKPYYTSNDSADKEVRVVVTDEATNQDTDKDYVNVVKKVKKENITAENIDEIMLSQIPGISTTTALAIIQKYASLANLIREIEKDPTTLKDVSYTNAKGQTRKINKTVTSNIVKFLLKK